MFLFKISSKNSKRFRTESHVLNPDTMIERPLKQSNLLIGVLTTLWHPKRGERPKEVHFHAF